MAELDQTGNLPIVPESGIPVVPDQEASAPVTEGGYAAGHGLVEFELSKEQIEEWWNRIEEARNNRKDMEREWEILMKEYVPKVTEGAEDLKSGIHFRNIHSKIPKLFFSNPELVLTAEGPLKDPMPMGPPMPGPDGMLMPPPMMDATSAAPVFQAVLKKKLGRKGVNSKRLVGEVLFDILAWAGLGCTKIGYRNATRTVQDPVMIPDPNWVAPPPVPSVLGLAPEPQPPMVQAVDEMTGEPKTQPRVVVIWEEWYWSRFSPKKVLIPADLHSSRFDEEAGWLGMEFFMPEHIARKTFQIPDDVELPSSAQEDELIYKGDKAASRVRPKKLIHGVEIWYKAHIYDETEPHPQAIRQLVLIEGLKEKACVNRTSPDQSFDAEGKLTPDSMIGFPIHLFTIRDMADTPWIKADTAFTNSSVKHINTHRKQSVMLRDANIPKFLYDTGAFTPEDIDRFKKGQPGEWIGVLQGQLAAGQDKIIASLVKTEASRDDWRTAEMLKQDVEEMMGISGSGAGVMEDQSRTATEITTAASSRAERMEDEQGRVLDTYLNGVEKYAALIQRYADDMDYVEVVGAMGQKNLMPWNRDMISARWAFDAKPDSQLRVDVARDRQQLLQAIKELAPFGQMLNIMPFVKKVANSFHIDPNELLPNPMMPPLGPPPGPSGAPPAGEGGGGAPGVPPAAPPVNGGALPNAPAPGAGTPEMQRKNELGN